MEAEPAFNPVHDRLEIPGIKAVRPIRSTRRLWPCCISRLPVQAKIHTFRSPATFALLQKFMRSKAGQRQVTHDENEDRTLHRARRPDEVRAVLAVVHAF